jgi:hypothetical protein
MKKLSLALLLIVPTLMFGQSALEGTWRTNMDQSQLSQKPYTFTVNGGMYECSSCVPRINIKADGTDQAVTGQSYDTLSARIDGPDSVTFVGKKSGKTVFEQTRTVTADGNTLTLKSTSYPMNADQPVQTAVTFTREEQPPTGANATSGAWRVNKINQSEAALTTTYKWSNGELHMSEPTGEHYSAKLDGKDYPYHGSYSFDAVSLRRIDEHTIEETAKRGGRIIEVSKISVSPDGKTLTSVVNNKLVDRTSTFVSEKQNMEAEK